MKKALLIIFGIVFILVLAFFGFKQYTKSFSPQTSAEYNKDGIDIKVDYSKPAKKGRYIFGRQQDKALLPYGKVWRTGANEATVIEIKQGVSFAGKQIAAGKYSLWTIPNQGKWQVILNSQTGQWGTEYNDGKNVLKADIPIRIRPGVQELFTIYFEKKKTE
ncbi:DUF2911 domain-containing protein [Dyadobacter sp. NIV53]|uniref:DUF2911 domain-containing protein n=1 Tax=Dyadobacter sp. NIV53 TaxID=2861765 RepID=UPI001E37AAA0|nr:DUF2911 domain-containing protein [Dyadobacter sp. NIV53]